MALNPSHSFTTPRFLALSTRTSHLPASCWCWWLWRCYPPPRSWCCWWWCSPTSSWCWWRCYSPPRSWCSWWCYSPPSSCPTVAPRRRSSKQGATSAPSQSESPTRGATRPTNGVQSSQKLAPSTSFKTQTMFTIHTYMLKELFMEFKDKSPWKEYLLILL